MPSLSRRRDAEDSRADRLESHIRSNDVARGVLTSTNKLPQCGKCKRLFEEQSKFCPFCDTKTMGYIAPIPDRYKDEALRGSMRRAKARVGL